MSKEIRLGDYGIFAMGDTPVARYAAVKLSATGYDSGPGLVVAAGNAGPIMGVVGLDNAVAGQATRVQVSGIVKIRAAEAIAIGDRVTTDAAGEAEVATTGHYLLGVAVSAGADGEIVEVDMYRGTDPIA